MSEALVGVIIGGLIAAGTGFLTSWWSDRKETTRWQREQRFVFLAKRKDEYTLISAELHRLIFKMGKLADAEDQGDHLERDSAIEDATAIAVKVSTLGDLELDDIVGKGGWPDKSQFREWLDFLGEARIPIAALIRKDSIEIESLTR